MFVFSSAPGVVGAVITGQALPFAVAVGGTGAVPGFPAWYLCKAVLTGFDYDARSGLGVTHTLRDRIYVYAFGERMGDATVTGVAFAGTCHGGATAGPNGGRLWTGFDGVHAYYERARVSTQGAPVRLVFGPDTTLAGFMDGFRFQLEDPQTGTGSFAFRFKVLPRTVTVFRTLPWETGAVPIPPAVPYDEEYNGEGDLVPVPVPTQGNEIFSVPIA